jgi:hypothetical protein
MIMNTEQEIMWTEAAVVYFKVLSRNFPVWTDGSPEKTQNIRCLDRDSKWVPLEYKCECLHFYKLAGFRFLSDDVTADKLVKKFSAFDGT